MRKLAPGAQSFGRFNLVRMLGRGGMGVVWLARDLKLQLDVALKFLPEAVGADESAVADLARETRRARELAHPHIVRVYDFHQDERLAGVSMEWVNGGTLSHRRLQQPHQIFEAVQLHDWVRELCSALGYAHDDARVVHRDLKPANLLVDARGRLKITDFGIAASISESVTRVSRVAPGSGTPPYMSPQQMFGGRPSPADDIYALGATLYELLTGKPPFYSGNIALQVQGVVPVSIAERRREFNLKVESLPLAWEETIAACLAKDVAKRPQSTAEIWRRLNNISYSGASNSSKASLRDRCIVHGDGVVETENHYVVFKSGTSRPRIATFKISKAVCGRRVSVEEVRTLVTKGRTDLLSGFVSKRGLPFKAHLVLSADRSKAEFEFPSR